VRPGDLSPGAAADDPAVQAVGEGQVPRPVARPGRTGRRAARERHGQVTAGDRDGEPVHQGIGDPDRHLQRGGQGQGAARGRGDLPGAGRAGHPDLRREHAGSQFVDVHPGHGRAGRPQQPAGQICDGELPDRQVPGRDMALGPGRLAVAGRPARDLPQAHGLAGGQPQAHRPAAGIIGQDDQDAPGSGRAVRPRVEVRLSVRDADGGHGFPP